MSLKNKVQLVGNVGQDVKIITLDSGKKIAKLSIVINENYTNSEGEKVENTDWHNLVCFGAVAEIAEKFITKGKLIAIEGKLKNNTYEDKEGVKRYATDIIVNEILLLGGNPSKE